MFFSKTNSTDPKDETQRQRARRLIKLSKDDLKKKCKENGLILSGKKGELVQRLMHPENPLNKKNLQSVNILTARKVEQVLRNAGVENPKACSQCLRGAIQLNKIKLLDKEILDSELVTEPCPNCKTEMTATVRDVLNQPDSAIGDDLRQHAPYKCPGCGQGYVCSCFFFLSKFFCSLFTEFFLLDETPKIQIFVSIFIFLPSKKFFLMGKNYFFVPPKNIARGCCLCLGKNK